MIHYQMTSTHYYPRRLDNKQLEPSLTSTNYIIIFLIYPRDTTIIYVYVCVDLHIHTYIHIYVSTSYKTLR
ncbi:hypothetical protein HanPSC8_Chr06g0242821 [Helianthus annuus]|nr:hypothetical protein HanPSC8_Chr06g0242821 [Helianthus annuus]